MGKKACWAGLVALLTLCGWARADGSKRRIPERRPGHWAGIDESGTLSRYQEKRWQTPTLDAGTYEFALTGDGDVDIYVRTGLAPTAAAYECRPYKSSSNETCKIRLSARGAVHVLVRGTAESSAFRLVGRRVIVRRME